MVGRHSTWINFSTLFICAVKMLIKIKIEFSKKRGTGQIHAAHISANKQVTHTVMKRPLVPGERKSLMCL